MDEELLKTAQQQVADAMNNAIGNVDDVQKSEEPSEFLKQHLSVEKIAEEEVVTDYVEPMQDPYKKAIKYLENHNIMQMFQQLTASIVYTKPERPLEFMMQEVERMKLTQQQDQNEHKK